MNDPQRPPPLASSGRPERGEPPADEDEPPLGWECANPVLQIERWLQDVGGAPALVSSNS